MEVKKLGVANVKMIVVAIAMFGTVSDTILADGKVSLTDFPAILKLTTELGVISHLDMKAVLPELSDLDAEEQNELLLTFDQNFKLGDHATLEAKLEAGLAAVVKAVEAIKYLIDLTKV